MPSPHRKPEVQKPTGRKKFTRPIFDHYFVGPSKFNLDLLVWPMHAHMGHAARLQSRRARGALAGGGKGQQGGEGKGRIMMIAAIAAMPSLQLALLLALQLPGPALALPAWSWDTVQTYVHCANYSGEWNAGAMQVLAKQPL
eukprot:SAG22_NODE_193_length_15643_cov_5.339424_5_plen_142_part_00